MSDLLEYLALGAAGIALFIVADNNIPEVRKAVNKIAPSVSQIIPVFTETPRAPVPPSRGCPRGMYEDYTDGILHCHDAHGIRQLNPNVVTNPIQRAWGARPGTAVPGMPGQNEPGQCINCTVPGQPGIGGQPGAPGIPGQPGRCYVDGVQVPCQGWASERQQDIHKIEETLDPDIPKSIAKTVLPPTKKQIKKTENKERRLIKERATDVISAQIECPKDLSKLTCGAHCYKDGHLMAVDCSAHKKKKPSLTIPPNFPNEVVITPGETPYPEETAHEGPQQDVGSTNPDWNPPSLELEPGQQPIRPTIPPGAPGQAPTPSAPAPPLTPIGRAVMKSSPTKNTGFTNGCGRSQNRDPYISCRAGIGTMSGGKTTKESGNQTRSVESLLSDKNHFFAIYDFHINPSSHVVSGHPQDVEVTGGYNGSNTNEPAVGVTIGIKPDGTPFCKKEDESHHKWPVICEGNCGGVKKVPNLGTNFSLIWAADKDGSTATYRGYVRTGGKEYLIARINPDIDFTRQNTYIRGRTNQLGDICPTGLLYDGRYQSSTGLAYSGPEGFILEGDGLGFSDEKMPIRIPDFPPIGKQTRAHNPYPLAPLNKTSIINRLTNYTPNIYQPQQEGIP